MKTLLSAAVPSSSTDPHSLVPRPSHPSELSSSLPTTKRPFGRRSTDSVECPKCGKRSIVARSQNTFDCLNCNFHRELPPVARQFVSQRGGLNSLLSPSGYRPSPATYRSPLESVDELEDAEPGQPWIFAVIAVIFGILLL